MSSLLGFTLGQANVGEMTTGFSVTVAGSAVSIDQDSLQITHRLSAPSTASFAVRGVTPAAFSDVQIYNGGSGGVRVFGGTATRVYYNAVRIGDDPWHQVECVDYAGFLLNRYKRVTAQYEDTSINTALRRLLEDFTDGGFRVGYCPASLGTIWRLELNDASVTDGIEQLATACGGFWDADADKRVHIFSDPDHLSADGITIDDTSQNFVRPTVQTDGEGIATRVIVLGDSTTTTSITAAGASTVEVEDVTPFVGASLSSGTALCEGQVLTYTGASARNGPGSLTGVSGVVSDVVAGAAIRVRAMAEDASAQSDLATALGGGLSGIAELTLPMEGDRDLVTDIAAAELAKRKSAFKSLTYTADDERHSGAFGTVPGQTVTVDLTTPTTVSGTYRVQQVDLSLRTGGTLSGTSVDFTRRINLGPYFRGLNVARRLAKVS